MTTILMSVVPSGYFIVTARSIGISDADAVAVQEGRLPQDRADDISDRMTRAANTLVHIMPESRA